MRKKNGQRVSSLVMGGILFFLLCGWATGQEKFPSRPISLIIPWAPGGGGTINAQILQPHLEKALQVSAQIINKPGGGGTIAWNYAAASPADGYTAAITNPSLLTTQYTTKTGVSYKKFDFLLLLVDIPAALAVRSDAPWKTFKEYIGYAKANPGKVQMGNSGLGANYHISALAIEMASGVKFTHVPFKGSAPAITALLGGHVDSSVNEISTLLPYVAAQKFRLLAVGSSERNFAVPDIPTVKESGYDMELIGAWYAYAVPKGVSKDRVKILHDAFKVAMDSKEYRAYYKKEGGVVKYVGPEDLPAFLDQQDRYLKKIIDFSGFKPID